MISSKADRREEVSNSLLVCLYLLPSWSVEKWSSEQDKTFKQSHLQLRFCESLKKGKHSGEHSGE